MSPTQQFLAAWEAAGRPAIERVAYSQGRGSPWHVNGRDVIAALAITRGEAKYEAVAGFHSLTFPGFNLVASVPATDKITYIFEFAND